MDVIWENKSPSQKISHKVMQHAHPSGDAVPTRGCRLCGGNLQLRPCNEVYVWQGIEERYDLLLYDCFGIKLKQPNCMICEWCVRQLRITERFRALVNAAFNDSALDLESKLSSSILPQSSKKQDRSTSATKIANAGKKILQLLTNSRKTETQCSQFETGMKKKMAKQGILPDYKSGQRKMNLYCTICNQKYLMLVPFGGWENFICSRCKRNRGLKSCVCKKCNISLPSAAMHDHLELHSRAELKGKSRLKQMSSKNVSENSFGGRRSTLSRFSSLKCDAKQDKSLPKLNKIISSSKTICPYCGANMKTPKSLQEHIMLKHNTKPSNICYQCPTCKDSFKSKRTLQTHFMTHKV